MCSVSVWSIVLLELRTWSYLKVHRSAPCQGRGDRHDDETLIFELILQSLRYDERTIKYVCRMSCGSPAAAAAWGQSAALDGCWLAAFEVAVNEKSKFGNKMSEEIQFA